MTFKVRRKRALTNRSFDANVARKNVAEVAKTFVWRRFFKACRNSWRIPLPDVHDFKGMTEILGEFR